MTRAASRTYGSSCTSSTHSCFFSSGVAVSALKSSSSSSSSLNFVITSYSIHYTKLYEHDNGDDLVDCFLAGVKVGHTLHYQAGHRITSYNVCYTKLLRGAQQRRLEGRRYLGPATSVAAAVAVGAAGRDGDRQPLTPGPKGRGDPRPTPSPPCRRGRRNTARAPRNNFV